MSISSDEVNFLIQRYFQESGFEHSAYSFNAESLLDFTNINGSQIPKGALITLLQKGLLYIQLEKQINNTGKPGAGAFNSQLTLLDAALREGSVLPQKQDKQQQPDNSSKSIPLDPSNSILLAEHSSDVLCCCWSSDGKYLATGSSDNSAIIWNMSDPEAVDHIILSHGVSAVAQHQISTLDWSPDGQFLVTGCSDGTVHVWSNEGNHVHDISNGEQKSAIHVVRFDPSGKSFISGSYDSHVIIRSTETGEIIRSINVQHGPVLDAAWRSEIAYAVCCEDGVIVVFDMEVNNGEPVQFSGHTGAVNGIAWDPSGELLASCSDDKFIRIWEPSGRSSTLAGHTNPVYAIRWNNQELIASASFDNTLRIWDPKAGTCLHVLASHTMPIYAVCFTPDGQYLASGSVDQTIKFWRVADGSLLASCMANQNIFDLQCDKEGKYIAACYDGGNVIVVPIANLPLHSE